MRTFTYTEHINRTPSEVFAFMMDFGQASRWRSMVRSVEVVGGGPPRQGGQLRVTFDVAGRSHTVVSTIWAYEPPHRLGQQNTQQGVTGTFEYRLAPEASGTRVTFTADVRPHGVMWLAFPFLLRRHRARYRDQLANLKRAIGDNG